MKYAIPLGAILLIGIASSLSRPRVAPLDLERPRSVPKTVVRETIRIEEAKPEPAESMVPAKSAEQKSSAPNPIPPAAAAWIKMLGTFDRSVGLTSAQQPAMEQLLLDREIEIRVFQQTIRTAGVLDLRDYDWRIDLMKDSWYRRIDALLDGPQHARFLTLLEKGFFNEGLALTIEPGMTVLD